MNNLGKIGQKSTTWLPKVQVGDVLEDGRGNSWEIKSLRTTDTATKGKRRRVRIIIDAEYLGKIGRSGNG